MRSQSSLVRRLAGQRGQALIETALTLPIVLVLSISIFEFGRAHLAVRRQELHLGHLLTEEALKERQIRHARREIAKLLTERPSLHDYPARQLAAAYRHAREDAVDETGFPLATFPEACPWVPEQILDVDFWPEEQAQEDAP